MNPSRGGVPVPSQLSAADAAPAPPSSGLQQFKLSDTLLVAAPKSGGWTKEQLEELRKEGMHEISERRFWHKAYMPNFPNPLPHHQGHQPAVLQPRGLSNHLLMAHDSPTACRKLMSAQQVQQRNSDLDWAGKRDQLLAMTAAGVHGVNFLVHYMNLQWRYLDHKYAPEHEHIYSQFGKW